MEKQECAAHYFITHFQNIASPHDVMDSAISDLGKGLPIPKRAMYFRRNRNVSLLFIVFSFVLIEFLYFVYQISVAPTKRSAASRTSCRLGVVTRKPQSTEFIDSGEHRRHYQLTLPELVPSTRRVRRPFVDYSIFMQEAVWEELRFFRSNSKVVRKKSCCTAMTALVQNR